MDFESIKKLINNDAYRKTLATIAQETGSAIDNREDSTILNIGLNQIRASTLKEEDFYSILDNHLDLFTRFSLERAEAFQDAELEQEYPEGEEPDDDEDEDDEEEDDDIDEDDEDEDEEEDDDDEDDEPSLLVISPIGEMIEFHYLLAKDDKGLAEYFKKLRLPKASEHIQEIKEIFQAVQ